MQNPLNHLKLRKSLGCIKTLKCEEMQHLRTLQSDDI